jgi:hypothetical protein
VNRGGRAPTIDFCGSRALNFRKCCCAFILSGSKYNRPMAIKAVVLDESNTHHLIIGLNRRDVESILAGNVFTLPQGNLAGMSDSSDVVIMFEETDEDLRKRFAPALRPA